MWITFWIIILTAIDQIFKFIARLYVEPINSITIIPGILDFTYVENRGAAFGFFQNQRWFFIIFAIIMISIFIYLITYKKMKEKLFIIASIFIIGGGIGNIIDRLFLGYVVDYIKVSFFPPVCNFADYCITLGTVLLMIYVLFVYKDENVILKEKKDKIC